MAPNRVYHQFDTASAVQLDAGGKSCRETALWNGRIGLVLFLSANSKTAKGKRMFLQIGAKPESDFTQPLDMLSDCHKRIQHFLNILMSTAEQAGDGVLTGERRAALDSALRYFRDAAPKHTADEERSLFPRMRSVDSSGVREALSKMEDLEADHQWADQRHAEAEAIFQKWMTEGSLADRERERLKAIVDELATLYQSHIALEESEIFPLAKAVLPEMEKQALGREMARRRGINAGNGNLDRL